MKQLSFELDFHRSKVTWQRMNTEGCVLEIVSLTTRKKFDHMLQVNQAIVYGGRRQEVQLLTLSDFKQTPVPRSLFESWVAEVMRLVHHDCIRHLLYAVEATLILAAPEKVGMIEDH